VARLLAPPNDADILGQLRRVRLVDGRVTIDDRKLGIVWSVPDVDFDMTRSETATRAQIDMSLAFPDHPAKVAGEARFVRAEGKAYLALSVADFDVAAAAPLADALKPLSAFAVPVTGDVHAVLDATGRLVAGDARLKGGRGRLVLPAYYAEPLGLKSLALDLHLADAGKTLSLDNVALDLGDAKLAATGTAKFTGPNLSFSVDADLAGIPLSRFDSLWPHGFAVGGRDWVTTHIPEGMIKAGKVHLAGGGRMDDPASIEMKTVSGAFDYTGLEVHYFPALPPVTGIVGHGTFDATRMDLTLQSGALLDLAVSNGAVALTGFDRDDRAIDINLTLDGPLGTALTVLDMKPLGYAHDLGIAPKDVGGHLDMRANFNFPLIKSLEFKQVQLGAQGTLDGVAVAAVVGKRDLTAGRFSVAVDKSGMRLTGDAKLSGVPATVDWQESFKPADPVRTRLAFRSVLDDAGRAALGFEPPRGGTLRGPIDVNGTVAISRDRKIVLGAKADIRRASLAIDSFGLAKKAGDAGTAEVELDFAGDTLQRIPSVTIASPDLTFAGAADFDARGSFRRGEIRHLISPRNDFALVADAQPNGDYAVSISGERLDVAPILAQKSARAAPSHTPKVALTLALDHVLSGQKASLDSVSGTATLAGSRLERASLKAFAGGPLTLTYAPEGDTIALHVAAENAGAALSAFGLTRGVRGGVLRVNGTTRTGVEPWLTTAQIDMTDFRLIDAPIIARLVNAISPTGFVDLLSGKGLEFDRLSAEMDFADGKITFRKGRSSGALAISFEGDVDLDRDKIALKGTVVPANGFNKIVAAIPVVGTMLTGGERGGFIGWTYAVSGTPNDPKVSVNPFSMFAPGFLRNLFFLGPREPQPKSEASPTAAAPAPQPLME
jgi:hypothetical protein